MSPSRLSALSKLDVATSKAGTSVKVASARLQKDLQGAESERSRFKECLLLTSASLNSKADLPALFNSLFGTFHRHRQCDVDWPCLRTYCHENMHGPSFHVWCKAVADCEIDWDFPCPASREMALPFSVRRRGEQFAQAGKSSCQVENRLRKLRVRGTLR